MKKLRKIVFMVSFVAVLCFSFNFNARVANAITADEIRAQIAILMAQISELQKQLNEAETGQAVWCHTFNRNLKYGDRGTDVQALETALMKQGFFVTEHSSNFFAVFDEKMASSVVGFQEKYEKEVLSQWGLSHGTGFVGKSTRAKLNALYGCGVEIPEKSITIEQSTTFIEEDTEFTEELTEEITEEPVIPVIMEGDADLNGCVSLADSELIQSYLVGSATLTQDQLKCADTNDDGAVSLKDSTAIKMWLADPDYPLWQSPKDDNMAEPVACSPATVDLDMLIFLSPQYKDDEEIKKSINKYINAVKQDIGWNTEVVDISSSINDFRKIDEIIENYHNESGWKLKACIMVGEDIHTALGGDISNCESPSTVPWSILGGEDTYEIEYHFHPGPDTEQIAAKEGQIDIAISLIYPTHQLDYQAKSSQIVSVFQKFSKNRDIFYPKDIAVFASSDLAGISTREVYQTLNLYGNLYYKEDATRQKIIESLDKPYKMYNVCGHSSPGFTVISPNASFESNDLDDLNTPLFVAGGCYTPGWYSDLGSNTDNGILDFSIDKSWYGSKIFKNPHLKVMILGMPHHWTASDYITSKENFIVNAIPGMGKGKTLAESIIKQEYEDPNDIIIYGDPTFHYNTVIEGKKIIILSPHEEKNWLKDNTYNIVWASWEIEKINLDIIDNKGNVVDIISGISADSGNYVWQIPIGFGQNLDLNSVRIKISDAENSNIFDENEDYFKIVDKSYIEVLWPNEDEKLVPGYIYWISWTSAGINESKIDIYKGDVLYKSIDFLFEEVQSYAWLVPENFKGEKYKIRISNLNNPEFYDESDNFFSILGAEPFIKVISPNGGEEWATESAYEIIWNSDGVNTIDQILLWGPGFQFQKEELIAEDILASQGKYSWFIPSDIPVGNYKIRISDDIGLLDDSDDYFSIIDGSQDIITLRNMENNLASIAEALSRAQSRINKLFQR